MGDFEDVFGAGADIDRIIDRFSREHEYEQRRERADYRRSSTTKEPQQDIEQWRNAMRSRGYIEGPKFTTYADLNKWEKNNSRPHMRMRFEVFFTDGKPADLQPDIIFSDNFPDDIPF